MATHTKLLKYNSLKHCTLSLTYEHIRQSVNQVFHCFLMFSGIDSLSNIIIKKVNN